MARKRVIDPQLFTSESVAALPISTRWTWVGLLCYLDDTGRGKDNAALVKASVWPLDDTYTARKVARDLDRLVDGGQLCRFTCCGSAQMHAPTWSSWQKPSHPTPTRLCPCPVHEPGACVLHESEPRLARDGFANDSGNSPRNVVEVSSEKRSSSDLGDCEHGVDRNASCRRCPSRSVA